MQLNDYQAAATLSARYPSDDLTCSRMYLALGLAGEAGEVANNVKKEVRDHVDKRAETLLELGDTLWYLSQLAGAYDFTLEEVAQANINKLKPKGA